MNEHLSISVSILVSLGSALSAYSILIAFRIITSKKNSLRNLYPFYTERDLYFSKGKFIKRKFQNTPPLNDNFSLASAKIDAFKFFKFYFSSDNLKNKFLLILAENGMGKTTLLLNLYLKYSNKFWFNKYKIRLFPLGEPNVIEKYISNLSDKEETILLLDGLDEDPKAIENVTQRLNEITNATFEFNFVVISCRTSFFTDFEIPRETGLKSFGPTKEKILFQQIYLSPLKNN